MTIFTETYFEARQSHGAIICGEYLELVVTEDRDYLRADDGEMYEIRVDAYDDDVVFLVDNPKIKFDNVECGK